MRRFFVVMLVFVVALNGFSQDYPEQFKKVDGYSISGEKQFYDRDNLYDYINGASDFYLGYKFQDLWVVDYANPDGKLVTLELYRHKNPMFAFGIYTEERPQGAKLSSIGAEGFIESGAVFFLAKDYYVKVYNGYPAVPEDELLKFSKQVASLICEPCALPEQFTWFPKKFKVASTERYMAENFMGITGFNGACTVVYENEGESIRLFAYKGDDEHCRAVIERYFTRLKYKKRLKEKRYQFDDPYIGKVVLNYKEGVICGLLDAKEPEKHLKLLDDLIETVQ
ncbi:DUF6599 family protein [Carboxylicivirga sp. N1Y90]|uniref:DUF6599 family protein n=1 Tax=Carboxylicivirga fragile TaxID=3417571 RepID=UPI003D3393E6|nr:hypothetical protein [Marinilabiliaceae bacterium N1Y90]